MPKAKTQIKGVPVGTGVLLAGFAHRLTKFELYGEEMIEKQVKPSGKAGRIYLPQEWVGKSIKIIRLH